MKGKGIAVDGWCSGNPGKGGYRGIDLETGIELFNWSTNYTTNNLVEFLAIIHACMYLEKHKINLPIYSDSMTGISWVRNKKCKTTLNISLNEELNLRIKKSISYLQKYPSKQIIKWNTKVNGEIPADFGRK